MNPKDRVKYIIDLMKMVLPTLKAKDEILIHSEKPSVDFRTLFNFKE